MGKKLYVGNLSYSTTNETLENLFSQAGKVESINIVGDRSTGQSRGFGFVEMSSQKEATDAIQKFNGYMLDGRNIVVNEARTEQKRESPRGGGRRRY